MNFEKIKEFAIEKKVYLIAAGILLLGFFYFRKGDNQEKNSEIENAQLMQKNSSSSSGSMENMTSGSASSKSKTVTCEEQ